MIAVYAQADDRQGVDAVLDGRRVHVEEPRFAALRSRAIRLNLRVPSLHFTGGRMWIGGRLFRLEFDGYREGDLVDSPIVVVFDRLRWAEGQSSETLAEDVLTSVAALGRSLDRETIGVALELATEFDRARQSRKNVLVGLGVVVIGITVLMVAGPRPRVVGRPRPGQQRSRQGGFHRE